ncbi:MAG: flagella basal body P-ring formation protein FlgA [Alphaproteobacteria bacterium]
MLRWFSVLACLYMLASALPAFADTAVTLRPRIEATGPAITLGDVFNGAGDLSTRPIAPAPAAGQITRLSAEFLITAANSAGLSWTPPTGLDAVQVTHPAGARAFVPASSASSAQASAPSAGADIAVHRGDTVLLTFEQPGIQLSTHARATADGAVGQTLRFVNLSSNRTIEATITGPGAASVEGP